MLMMASARAQNAIAKTQRLVKSAIAARSAVSAANG